MQNDECRMQNEYQNRGERLHIRHSPFTILHLTNADRFP
jgi:hypothetical protein